MKNSVRLVRHLSAVMGMALLAVNVHAQVTKVGNAYQFRVKYHKGMKIKYVMKFDTILPAAAEGRKAQSIVMSVPVSGTVTDVQNRIATLEMTTGPTIMNGQPQGTPQTVTLKLDDRGKPIGGAPSGMQNLMAALPDKPMKVGDTYASKEDITIAQMPVSVNSVSKFMGMKSVGGHQVAMFTVTLNGSGSFPSAQGGSAHLTTKGSGLMSRSAEDGLITRTNMDLLVTVPQGGQTLKLKLKTVFERQ